MSLPPIPDDFGEDDVQIVSQLAEPCSLSVEGCGSTLEDFILRLRPRKRQQGAAQAQKAAGPAKSQPSGGKKKKKVTSTKLSEQEQDGEHYEVLGLEEREIEATEDEIRAAYKVKCLETHPDKTGGDDTLFKAVQLAADVLLNPDKRRAFDSALPFDDSIPNAKVEPEKFFAEFGSCFSQNAKWCAQGRANCPLLGDDSTPIEVVDEFYRFWFAFKSWRDFSAEAAEHDLEDAEDRYGRRWMEKENAKAVEKLKRAENARVRELVERAYKNDPRIKRRDREIQAEKEAKAEARRQAEEDKKKREQEEEERRRVEEEERKALHKERLLQLKKARQTFRKLTKDWPEGRDGAGATTLHKPDLEWLLAKIDLDGVTPLLDAVQAHVDAEDVPAGIKTLYEGVVQMEEKTQESRRGGPLNPQAKKAEAKREEESKKQEALWSGDELLELQKACVKYPAGTMDRWRKLSEFMGQKKSPEQILKKVKQLEAEYRMPQQGGKGQSLRSVGQKMPELPAAQAKRSDDKFNEQDKWYRDHPERKFDEGAADAYLKPDGAPAAAAAAPAAAEEDIWSTGQQRQLESALRDLKAYKEKDKWEKIAAAVDGKTKKQCVARYKFLCAAQKKK